MKGNELTPMKGFHRAAGRRRHLSGMLVEKTALGWWGRKGKVGITSASMVSALQPGHPHPTREAASQHRGTEDGFGQLAACKRARLSFPYRRQAPTATGDRGWEGMEH